jgi:hypothetical protein
LGELAGLRGLSDFLEPDCFIGVATLREGTAALSMIQRVRTIQRPAAYGDSTDTFPTYTDSEAVTTKRQGSTSKNEIIRVSLPRDCYGGSWQLTASSLGVAHNVEISTDDIPFGSTALAINELIDEAFGEGNEVTVKLVDNFTIDITFSGDNVKRYNHNACTADYTGLLVPKGWTVPFNLRTGGVESILDAEDSITAKFEIQNTIGDDQTTIYQGDVILVNDLIDVESIGATEFPGYPDNVAIENSVRSYVAMHYAATLQDEDSFGWFVPGVDCSIVAVSAFVQSAPVGASVIVDIVKNAAEQSATTTISAGQSKANNELVTPIVLTNGDQVQCKIKQIGSTSAGEFLTILLHVRPIF